MFIDKNLSHHLFVDDNVTIVVDGEGMLCGKLLIGFLHIFDYGIEAVPFCRERTRALLEEVVKGGCLDTVHCDDLGFAV